MFYLALIYSFLWLLIGGYDAKSLFFGSIAVGFALVLHRVLGLYPQHINPLALLHFFLVFLWQAFLGGVDVAKRVLSPSLRVNPGFVVYHFNSDKFWVKTLLSLTINLTPGTLSVVVEDRHVLVHTLDVNSYSEETVRELERLIERIFQ